MPNVDTMAKLTQSHYSVDGKKGKKKITKKADALGYDVVSVNRGVVHYKNRDDGSNVISVKGTDVSNMKDLVSDAKLGLGLSSSDKQFKQRRNEIKKIYRNSEGDNYLTSHSLGSSIALSSLAKSKSIRDNTKSSYGFNTGYTPAFHSEISKGLSKTDKKEIKGIHTNYHVSGDLVSTALNNNSLGEVQVVKAAKGSTILDKHSLENFTGDNDDL
tara:strand:- start:1895 stop:2539 length:645 start_codon:yes stop_codon:yes gene_type:complete